MVPKASKPRQDADGKDDKMSQMVDLMDLSCGSKHNVVVGSGQKLYGRVTEHSARSYLAPLINHVALSDCD
ncbi:hypothetical protein Vi05172_g13118 [Venturia inaequalis]|nr:hypothetical protein Vi05172_g13118 [Venturia inaequalis]